MDRRPKKSSKRVHPRDEAIKKAVKQGLPVPPPPKSCTGCEYREACRFPCTDIEKLLPAEEPPRIRFTDRGKWRRTQYVLDHEEQITNPIWRRIIREHFRKGRSLFAVAVQLGLTPRCAFREVDRLVRHLWRLDRRRNSAQCRGD